MKLAIASGKGGTGKTTLAVNLATALAGEGSVGLLDCDVEEPNCHLYLRPSFGTTEPVATSIPVIDPQACTGCGLCARACEFNALLALPGAPMLMPELCHGCGVCVYVCPEEAVADSERRIGALGSGAVGTIYFRWGRLDVGEARSTPVIRAVKDLRNAPPLETVIIDAPPGVACPVVETLRGVDFTVLVAEPTPFGLHDLKFAVQTTREMGIPCAVVINRAGIGDHRVNDFCSDEGLPILLEIPDNRLIAEACSRGEVFAATNAAFAADLRAFAVRVRAHIAGIPGCLANPQVSAGDPVTHELMTP